MSFTSSHKHQNCCHYKAGATRILALSTAATIALQPSVSGCSSGKDDFAPPAIIVYPTDTATGDSRGEQDTDSAPCDGSGYTVWYFDEDHDGYGTSASAVEACEAPATYWVTAGGDCDDTDPSINPAELERCSTSADDDCDGSSNTSHDGVDPIGCVALSEDADEDGWGSGEWQCLCEAASDYTAVEAGDCDDTDPEVYVHTDACRDIAEGGWIARLDGASASEMVASSIAGGADLTGDGIADLVVGSVYYDDDVGALYVVEGPVTGAITLDATSSLLISGRSGSAFYRIGMGGALAMSDDLTGDGAADLAMSSWGESEDGQVTILDGPLMSDVVDDLNWASWSSSDDTLKIGDAIASMGTLDGDGGPTLVIGAPTSDGGGVGRGEVFLEKDPSPGAHDISEVDTVIVGAQDNDFSGGCIEDAGDLDGDGVSELLIAAPFSADIGKISVVSGPFDGTMDLGDADAVFWGDSTNAQAGNAMAGRGDFDDDGLGDVLIGAGWDSGERGAAYLIAGPPTGRSPLSRSAELRVIGAGDADWTGWGLAFSDVADGGDQLVIGSSGANFCATEGGATTWVSGPGSGTVLVGAAGDTVCGDAAYDTFGEAIANVGDWDVDGTDDLLVSTPGASPGGVDFAGSVYLMPGALPALASTAR